MYGYMIKDAQDRPIQFCYSEEELYDELTYLRRMDPQGVFSWTDWEEEDD